MWQLKNCFAHAYAPALQASSSRRQAHCLLERAGSMQRVISKRLACLSEVRASTISLNTNSTGQSAEKVDNSLLPPELAGFRPNVGVCIVNKQGLVFAATRVDDPGKSWQMPQGGIDPGETPLQAAVREVHEETNISSVELLAEAPNWLPYEFPTSVLCKLSGSWAKYKGQAQRWFLFKFTGDDSEIDLDAHHKEFSEWRWMPLEELPAAVIEFKKAVYEQVAAEFGPAVQDIRPQANSSKGQGL